MFFLKFIVTSMMWTYPVSTDKKHFHSDYCFTVVMVLFGPLGVHSDVSDLASPPSTYILSGVLHGLGRARDSTKSQRLIFSFCLTILTRFKICLWSPDLSWLTVDHCFFFPFLIHVLNRVHRDVELLRKFYVDFTLLKFFHNTIHDLQGVFFCIWYGGIMVCGIQT